MRTRQETIEVNSSKRVSAVWAWSEAALPIRDAFVLAHGAGAGMEHEFISYFHGALARVGHLSVKFNFPYKEEGRKAPDRGPLLEATYRRVLEEVQTQEPRPERVFIGGKSMGGRIASYLAAEGVAINGAYFLGYPLHPPHRPERLRSDHFPRLRCPLLFIQGSRDALCRLDLLKRELEQIPGPVTLHVVQGGDHSFSVPKKSGRSREEVRQEVLQAILDWSSGL